MNTFLTLCLVLSCTTAVTSHFVTPFDFMPRFPMFPMGFHPMMRPMRRRMVAIPMNGPFGGGMMAGGGSLAMAGGMGVLGSGMVGSPGVAGTTLVSTDNIDNSVIAVNGGVMGGQFINTDNSVMAVPNGGVMGGNRVIYLGDAPDPDVTTVFG